MAKSLEETVAKENVCKQSVVREAENYFRGLEKRKKSLAQGLVCVPCWLRVKCPPHNQNQELFVLLRETSNESVKKLQTHCACSGPRHRTFEFNVINRPVVIRPEQGRVLHSPPQFYL